MKRLHIIGGPLHLQADPSTEDVAQFAARATKQAKSKPVISYCSIDDLVYVISGNSGQAIFNAKTNEDIATYDVVWFRGKLSTVMNEVVVAARYLAAKGVTSSNTSYSQRQALGKVAQMCLLAENKLPMPKSIFAPQPYMAAVIAQNLTYPIIVKDIHGSHGEHNYLVRDEHQLRTILAENSDVSFIAQEFIEANGDYRILFAGDRYMIIHRQGSDSHLNNTSQGAIATLVEEAGFNKKIISDARLFATIYGYEIAGVDVIIDRRTGEYYFLEINSQPQVLSGAFVTEKEALLGHYFADLLTS